MDNLFQDARTMIKQTAPLIELLYQEFPNKDPIEIERIVNTVKKWLEQRLEEAEGDIKIFNEKADKKIEPWSQGHIIILKELIHKLIKENKH
jgi:hypothetical protein